MSAHPSLVTLVTVVITGFVFAGQIFLGTGGAFAEGSQWETRVLREPATAQPVAPQPRLDARDEIAALERIHYALSEVGDGATYVWRRWHGNLSGVIHPTASFKDDSGQVCRHLMVLLTTGTRTSKLEGIACRLPNGRWRLDG